MPNFLGFPADKHFSIGCCCLHRSVLQAEDLKSQSKTSLDRSWWWVMINLLSESRFFSGKVNFHGRTGHFKANSKAKLVLFLPLFTSGTTCSLSVTVPTKKKVFNFPPLKLWDVLLHARHVAKVDLRHFWIFEPESNRQLLNSDRTLLFHYMLMKKILWNFRSCEIVKVVFCYLWRMRFWSLNAWIERKRKI